MNNAESIGTASQQDADYETEVDRLLVAIEHSREGMDAAQQRIERLRAETRTMLDETREVLRKLAA